MLIGGRLIFSEKRNARLKDQELILRFLAMSKRHEKYARPMRDFLNDFTGDYANPPRETLERFRDTFARAIKVIWDAKGRAAFRPSRALNAAVFEGVMLGVAAKLVKEGSDRSPRPTEIAAAYDRLLSESAFLRACERATADEESVRTRRTLAIAAFAG